MCIWWWPFVSKLVMYLSICKIWGLHDSDYEECRLLWYENLVRTSQETYCVSDTEPSRLILCTILGFYGGDYEERHLLGYKNTDLTSQETYYASTTKSSQLTLCKIWGFQESDYEKFRLLGCYAVWRLLVTSKVDPSSLILFISIMQAIRSSEMSVLTRATGRYIPENVILQSDRRVNLKSYINNITTWPLVRRRNKETERPPLVGRKLLPTYAARGVLRGKRSGSARSLITVF
jgi:hypothetical protein